MRGPFPRSGVTLIEIVLAMAILAVVLLAILIPSFGHFRDSQELAGAADLLAADLKYARSLAVEGKEGLAEISVRCRNGGSAAYDVTDAGGSRVFLARQLPVRVQADPPFRVTFVAGGAIDASRTEPAPTGGSVALTLRGASGQRRIQMNALTGALTRD